jgi:hypothetical protein
MMSTIKIIDPTTCRVFVTTLVVDFATLIRFTVCKLSSSNVGNKTLFMDEPTCLPEG